MQRHRKVKQSRGMVQSGNVKALKGKVWHGKAKSRMGKVKYRSERKEVKQMSEEKIKAVWKYCRETGIMNRRETFDRNVAGSIRIGNDVTDIAVHIRVHGRCTGKTLTDLERDLSEILAA